MLKPLSYSKIKNKKKGTHTNFHKCSKGTTVQDSSRLFMALLHGVGGGVDDECGGEDEGVMDAMAWQNDEVRTED